MEIKLRKAGPTCSELYEMNLGTARWYFVSRKNMEIQGPAELVRNLFNSLLIGLTATLKGSYARTTKKLKLVL